MGILPKQVTYKMDNIVQQLAQMMLPTITQPPVLTYQELLNLIADPADHDLLMRARRIGNLDRDDGTYCGIMNADEMTIHFSVNGRDKDAPILPRSPQYAGHPQIDAYVRDLKILVDEWAMVNRVWRWLRDNCRSLTEARYLWPSILVLLDHAELLEYRAMVLEFKPVRDPVVVPFEMREQMKKASATVGMLAFLPPYQDTPNPPLVEISTKYSRDGISL